MRPHRLRVTAFGAFGGSVEVDFDDLAASGLFLMHGETGAGKTTLLDAIGFALYGRVPGERGKARRLRSDHAAPALATEVQLEATLGGRRLRITRKPEQVRPKRRGDGFTTEQARILVEEGTFDRGEPSPRTPAATMGRGQQWRTLSTRAGEADAEIADLMGMSAEQFFQVVLLPQGQFAQFLQADAEGRRKLLQRLFGTDRFRAVEEWLAERRATAARQVADAEGEIGQLVARVAEVAGVPMPDGLAKPGWAGQLAGVAEADADRAAVRVAGCRTALDAALERQREAERLAERQHRRAEAVRRQADLAAAQPHIAERRGQLDAAQRAAEAAPVLAAADEAATMLAQARIAEDRARAEVGDHGLRDADPAVLRDAAQQRQQQAGQLDALRSLADQAATEDAAATTADEAAASLAAEAATLRTGLDERRRERERHGGALEAAQSAAADLPDVRAASDRYRRAAADAAALVRARTDAERHRQEHVAAREEAVGLREEASRLREARIDGMRAELAADLTDGMPCPVCGSLDHPELCELRGERVTRQQEEAAAARAEAAARAAEAIGENVTAAQTRVSDLAARLDEAGFTDTDWAGVDVGELRARERDLEALAYELHKEASRLGATAAKLDELQAAFESLGQAIADAETRLAEVAQQRAAELDKAQGARRRAAAHLETLRGHLGDVDLDTALGRLRADAGALTTAADAAEAAARAVRDATRTREAAQRAAADAGFPDVAAATAAQRDSAWRAAADRAVREHESSAVAVAGLLASADLDVPLDPPADVTGAAQAAELASQAYDEAVATQARAQRKAEQLAALAPDLTARVGALAPLAARAAEARQLADLAAGLGANTLRMTLSSFVLAARLEEVAEAASQRLLRMTAGRYSLVHTDNRRGGGRSGLGLLACDAWTGVDRDTSTLSGGETFMASLALALGLADVVTEEAGGARIEALFVDEGFGSLDEETLEEVMNVLDGLREGGRCVGIVSHVSELRQRIPAQVRVRKTHSGSSVSIVRG
ncbi:MAG TPA: SMC family ATPase [Streptosporangiaceae bacterium]